jgi:hypothetical protein
VLLLAVELVGKNAALFRLLCRLWQGLTFLEDGWRRQLEIRVDGGGILIAKASQNNVAVKERAKSRSSKDIVIIIAGDIRCSPRSRMSLRESQTSITTPNPQQQKHHRRPSDPSTTTVF